MRRHLACGILALGLFAGPMAAVASAEPSGGSYQQDMKDTGRDMKDSAQNAAKDMDQRMGNAEKQLDPNAHGANWGWLGLLGLGGLAGLLRRPHQDETTRQRTGYRASEPIGTR